MRTHFLYCALVALLIPVVSGCSGDRGSTSSGRGLGRWNPFARSAGSIASADTPPLPSSVAGPAGAGSMAPAYSPNTSAAATMAAVPSYPGRPASYTAPDAYSQPQQPYPSTGSTGYGTSGGYGTGGYGTAAGSSPYVAPQQGYYPSDGAAGSESPYATGGSYGGTPSATAPYGNPVRQEPQYGGGTDPYGTAPPAGSQFDQGMSSPYGTTPATSGASGGGSPAVGQSDPYASPDYGTMPSYGGQYTPSGAAATNPTGYQNPGPAAGGYPSAGMPLSPKADYAPGNTGYQPGQTSYSPPGVPSYSSPASPYAAPASPYASPADPYASPPAENRQQDQADPPPYLPGSTRPYGPQTTPNADPLGPPSAATDYTTPGGSFQPAGYPPPAVYPPPTAYPPPSSVRQY